jgi:hypothetical protein
MGMGDQRHVSAALSSGKTRYLLYRRLGGPKGRSGRVRKIWSLTGIRSPDPLTCSKSLYRLRYPCPCMVLVRTNIYLGAGVGREGKYGNPRENNKSWFVFRARRNRFSQAYFYILNQSRAHAVPPSIAGQFVSHK